MDQEVAPAGPRYEQRRELLRKIEELRDGRCVVSFMNFDRASDPPVLPGLRMQFESEAKEALFRVLKDSVRPGQGIDLFVFTRGGDVNAVWPIVSIIREFDPDFEVLVPYRCHSAGTLLALGAKRIHLGPLSELSPIDPSTGNQFNPMDPGQPPKRLGIAVEDVQQYRDFILRQFEHSSDHGAADPEWRATLAPFLKELTGQVHPLALGNVHRVHNQIRALAQTLLSLRGSDDGNEERIKALTRNFYSHTHAINRFEAQKILGDRVRHVPENEARAMDELLRGYEDRFELRKPFFLGAFMGDEPFKKTRFVSGVIESVARSYLYATCLDVRQRSKFPDNVQVQLPAGQPLPLVPGLPREFDLQATAQAWEHNPEPKGVTT